MLNAGDFLENKTVRLPFNTFDSNGGSITVTDLVAGDVRIYKDGSLTQRSNASGISVIIDHDGEIGGHEVVIDLSDNTDAGFYSSGSDYKVRLIGITVDTQTLNPWPGEFSINNRSNIISRYDGGIWIDSGAGNANTVTGVDGIPSNPVSTLAAARTLANALGVQKYYLINASALTLATTHQSWVFEGVARGNIINLGFQNVDNSIFTNLSLAGTQGGTLFVKLDKCTLTSLLSLRPWATNCGIAGNITILSGVMQTFDQCYSCVPGNTAPILTFSAGVTSVNFRHYSGGLEVKTMTSDHTISYETDGQLIVNVDCTSGNITARGNMSITDNGSTMNITKDAVYNKQEARDAMKVSPTAGAPAAGSVDEHLDDILEDTGTSGVLLSAPAVDSIFTRASSNYDSVMRSLGGVVAKLMHRFKNNTATSKAEVYKSNDTDVLGTQTITADATADPVVEVNTD